MRAKYLRSELPKECIACKQTKPALDFSTRRISKDGLQPHCSLCYGSIRRYNRYRLSQDDYNVMLKAQGNACAICETQFIDGFPACVDHDHNCCPVGGSCGVCVRGLLCGPCNKGIGLLKDDPQLLRQAVLYLEGMEVASV